MKKLYLDIGNSNIKVYEDNKKVVLVKNTKDNKVIESMKSYLKKDNYFIISSVQIKISKILKEYFVKNGIGYYFFNAKDYHSFFGQYNINLDELGVDRAVNIVATQSKLPKAIIFDFGTALTIDVVSKNTYTTGFIYPGLDILKKGLSSNTSLLDDFEFENIQKGPLLTTNGQINDALILGVFGAINAMLEQINTLVNLDEYKIILTGGTFRFLFELLGVDKFDELMKKGYEKIDDLNYLGLKEIEKKIKTRGIHDRN